VSKVHALKLTLGGAPDVPHQVDGLPGTYRPGTPVPLGEDGPVTLDMARAFIKAHDEKVKADKKAWDEYEKAEAAKGAHGLRPNGPQPFVEPGCPVQIVQISESKAATGGEEA
jgi:hypothetical protein